MVMAVTALNFALALIVMLFMPILQLVYKVQLRYAYHMVRTLSVVLVVHGRVSDPGRSWLAGQYCLKAVLHLVLNWCLIMEETAMVFQYSDSQRGRNSLM